MTKPKNNNSILFLTTLGVYIGLLMAGASPTVIAQQSAAMTRNFDVKDEIEVKDDLDNKPDFSDEDLDTAIEKYSKRVELFIRNLKKLRSIEEFDPDWQTFDSERITFAPCPETGTLRSNEDARHLDPWLVPVITEANFITEEFTVFADCLPFDGFVNRNHARSTGIKLRYDKSELIHGLSLTLETEVRSNSLYKGLSSAFERFEIEKDEEYELNKVLLKHTSLTVSGSQVFIVTRLPRAALDELLATDAK